MDQAYRLCISDFSTNGTYINNERMEKGVEKTLKEGDVVSFSPVHDASKRFASLPSYVVKRFDHLSNLEEAHDSQGVECREFQVPCSPKLPRLPRNPD